MGLGERWSLLRNLRDGVERLSVLDGKRIFRTAQGKWYTWKMIIKNSMPWTFTEEGNMSADKAMEMGAALCFSERMVREMGYTGPKDKFFDWLFKEQLREDPCKEAYEQNITTWKRDTVEGILTRLRKTYLLADEDDYAEQSNLNTLKDMFKEEYKTIPYSKLRKTEKRVVDVLNTLSCWKGRRISIGVSPVAKAWTNGSTYINFERSWLKRLDLNSSWGVLQLFTVGAHEMAHDDDSAKTHIHGPEFYARYYEITHDNTWGDNPLYHAFRFKKYMSNSRIEMKKAEEEEKERKAQEKLGLQAANTK